MLDTENLFRQYLNNIEPDNSNLPEYFEAYQFVIDKFGSDAMEQPGQIELLGWDIEYVSPRATLPNFIDQILVRRLNDFVPENDHPMILDCGANIGFSSLSYKRQFPQSRIIAFEPDQKFAPVLQRNLERNGAGDVRVVEAAVWIRNGTSQWYSEGIDGSHLCADTDESLKVTTVRTVDLGDFLNEPIDLIKMDIEGAEYEVVNQLGPKLQQVKAMSIECHLNQRTMVPFGEMVRTLSSAGFQLSINSFGAWRDLVRQTPIRKDHYENYILVSAWRGSLPSTRTHTSWIPNAGVAPITQYKNLFHLITHQFSLQMEQHSLQLSNQASEFQAPLLASLKSYALSGEQGLKRVQLVVPFQRETGFCWVIPLNDFLSNTDDNEHPNRSTLLLYEDDHLLQPAHALHEDIRNLGGGRYSYWNGALYFSTTDGSDPNTNGRRYRVVGIP
jgi:FkbM family methyltransferase